MSKDLGKTRGIPKIPTMGIRPIRSATGKFRDSNNHIGYLRIATPDDPPEARPISLVEIAKQQEEFRSQVGLAFIYIHTYQHTQHTHFTNLRKHSHIHTSYINACMHA